MNDSKLHKRVIEWLDRLDRHELHCLTVYLSALRKAKVGMKLSTKVEHKTTWQQAADANLAAIKTLMRETKL